MNKLIGASAQLLPRADQRFRALDGIVRVAAAERLSPQARSAKVLHRAMRCARDNKTRWLRATDMFSKRCLISSRMRRGERFDSAYGRSRHDLLTIRSERRHLPRLSRR